LSVAFSQQLKRKTEAVFKTSADDAVDDSSTGIQRPHSGIDSWIVYDRYWHKADVPAYVDLCLLSAAKRTLITTSLYGS